MQFENLSFPFGAGLSLQTHLCFTLMVKRDPYNKKKQKTKKLTTFNEHDLFTKDAHYICVLSPLIQNVALYNDGKALRVTVLYTVL